VIYSFQARKGQPVQVEQLLQFKDPDEVSILVGLVPAIICLSFLPKCDAYAFLHHISLVTMNKVKVASYFLPIPMLQLNPEPQW